MDGEPILLDAIVTCHTPGCVNEDLPIHLAIADVVVCGPCTQPITDITPTES